MPEMKCWHHPWISARWNNNKRPTNTLKVRPNLNRNSNFYVLKKFSNQNIQINPDLWTSKTSLSWKIFFFLFGQAFVSVINELWKLYERVTIYGISKVYVWSFPWSMAEVRCSQEPLKCLCTSPRLIVKNGKIIIPHVQFLKK